ncbi:succinylglutamate desuccinylase [Erythrobacter arachoides]|uniref:Succinylglutamate desuccinylase n=1 Tax=Aurantiacibacter arachoides TaxID=1850444 RepID=A0A844ZWY5_9SPHN|nr:succinylglutamate desuccinylase/aspartoacylase family protein [Aurantiacibacter arachoides]MXO92801.1 succinylglutamate desuccinylase [Aurantiacibacter arachoides]
MGHAFEIGGIAVARGTRQRIALPISHTLTGLSANLMLEVVHGATDGPTVFVSAAIHGDEIAGTAIIQRLIPRIDAAQLAGTIILAPAVNIYGFIAQSRYLPDRRDLNRSFPGNPNGSLASQLAHCFFENVICRSTLGIDLHSAAVHRYNLPQVRIAAGDERLIELATVFGAPIIIESPLREGSMRQLAHERGTPMLLLEAGEALRFDRFSTEVGTRGVLRVLAHIGMLPGDDAMANVPAPSRSNRTRWVRAPRGGVSHRLRKSGDSVTRGEVLARVGGVFGEDCRDVISPIDGIVIGHATLPVVYQGDAMFHIAEVEHPERAGERIASLDFAIHAKEPAGPARPLMDEDEVEEMEADGEDTDAEASAKAARTPL